MRKTLTDKLKEKILNKKTLMRRKLGQNKGITLIALIITIIVLLILAGVSIAMLAGENGILRRVIEARDKTREESRVEILQILINDYNIDTGIKENHNFTNYLNELKGKEEIEDYFGLGQKIVVKYQGEYYLVEKKGDFYKVGKNISTDLKDNEIGKSYLINSDNVKDTESLEFQKGSSYIIIDDISTENFNFVIPSAEGNLENAVTIYLLSKMIIDNKGYDRSAIELLPGAILNLYVYDDIEVNSGFGKEGQTAEGLGAKGGLGGYAGIHVPETSTLNLYGEGTLIAIGGNAGEGGGAVTNNTGGGRRWPEQELV